MLRVLVYYVMSLFPAAASYESRRQRAIRVTMDLSLGGRWQAKAACSLDDVELFLPSESGQIQKERAECAKKICRKCPVVRECLEYALKKELNSESDGVLGGMTPRERRNLKDQNNQ